ncbi:MAG: hypothetical protein J2P25_17105 [Nocardiopsaceae bacterium]|nr:hypothetical protein [Nocardiopsaceae bacterium]
MPEWADPQLATLTHQRFSDPGWIYERKLDGERCLAFAGRRGVQLMSRNQQDLTSTFPEIAEALESCRHGDLIADGEIVAFSGGQTRFTQHRNESGEAYWEQACRDGWEGVIAKRACAPYEGGRSGDWLKFKCENAQELVIGGYTDPQRSRVGFGALLLGYYDSGGDLVYAGKVGTGFDTATLRRLHDRLSAMERGGPAFARGRLPRQRGVHWVEPRLVGQVAFTEWTGDGQLRHPRFQGLRDDKDPRDVVREVPHG